MEFDATNNLVTVRLNGKKEILSVKIDAENLDKDDIESLEDMIMLAVNKSLNEIDKVTEEKMGKYSSFPGLF